MDANLKACVATGYGGDTGMKKKIAGIVLICLALGLLGFWELWGRQNIGYDEILVLRESASKSTVVEASMLTTRKVESAAKAALRPGDESKIIGMETRHFIPESETLYQEYFAVSRLTTGGSTDSMVLSIPEEWLETYPQTIRRGDDVAFYCGGMIVTKAVVAYARDGNNAEVTSSGQARLTGSAPVSVIEVIVSEKQAVKLGKLADKGNKFVLLYSTGGDA